MCAADTCRVYRQLARNNALANARLHRACLALKPGEWEAERVSFFPSIRATMNHILVIDRFYMDAIEGGTLGPKAWANPVPCPEVARLVDEQAAMDQSLVELCDGLLSDDLARDVRIHRKDRVQVEPLGELLLHMFLHDQHHRGQVHAMLSGTSVRPPQLDEFVTRDDAAVRADDLAAMGWDETYLSS
ncbi:MAG: damage-inducible protein DinB [Cereibacter sphaeroides]|uniref:Damage-inducible protein DinB n=1 Tax=Cereibacter sphaeroides TaxID=1063 RepID=A0A2W5SAJ0_CERSP|nr:MAG: damage-inducible protein DinB [Cereibacter sphaeroides]